MKIQIMVIAGMEVFLILIKHYIGAIIFFPFAFFYIFRIIKSERKFNRKDNEKNLEIQQLREESRQLDEKIEFIRGIRAGYVDMGNL